MDHGTDAGGERERVRAAIDALEAQRSVLGDEVVDTALAPLRAQLDELTAPSKRERRQVTVLFADITGFTTMSEALDAEAVGRLLEAFWETIDGIITAHDGVVFNHMGDGLMALWGDTVSREDDAEQAVRAGLAMLEYMASHGLVVDGKRIDHNMRVGVHTGAAHVSARGQRNAIGDTVNVAARLESAAPHGGLLVSRSTFTHIRGIFHVADAGELQLKGRTEPVHAYQVIGALPRAFRSRTRGIEGVETEMVGRRAELDTVAEQIRRSVHEGDPTVTVLLGEPGIGKSRLLAEARDVLETTGRSVRYFEGHCAPETVRQPFGMLRNLLAHRFQISDNDDRSAAYHKIVEGVVELVGERGSQLGASMSWLVGFDDGHGAAGQSANATVRRRVAVADTIEFFGRLGSPDLPVAIWLEDLHWADDASLELFESFLCAGPVSSVVLVTSRTTLLERRPIWGEPAALGDGHLVVHLTELDVDAAGELVDRILEAVPAVDPGFRAELIELASGNPFHLEELVKMLIDDGVIVPGEVWTIRADRLDRSKIPTSLIGVLQARLDRLDDDAFATLQAGSVFGRYFWVEALGKLVDEPADPTELVTTELVHRQPLSRLVDTTELGFRHEVTSRVTYDTIVLPERPRLHGAAASWLEQAAGDRRVDHAAVIAWHLDQAEQRERAAEWWALAARAAIGRSEFDEGLSMLAEAIERTTDPVRRDDLRIEQSYALTTAGHHDAAAEITEAMIAGDAATPRHALLARSELARIRTLRDGDFDTAEQLLSEGIARQDDVPAGDPSRHGLVHQLGILQIARGRFDDALPTLQRAADEAGDNDQRRGMSLNAIAHVYAQLDRFDEAIELAHEVERIGRECGDTRLVMGGIAQRALVALHDERWDDAAELFAQSQQINERNHDVEKIATVGNYLGEVALGAGACAEARRAFERAARVAARGGVVPERLRALLGLAALAADLGERETATAMFSACLAHPSAMGEAQQFGVRMTRRFGDDLVDPSADPATDLDAITATLAAVLDRHLEGDEDDQ